MINLKEQIKTFVKGMTPSNTQQDTLIKENLDEEEKHLQSKTKEVLSTKSRVSVLNYLADKEEKATSNDLIPSSVNIEVLPFEKGSPVVVGDNLVVYDGDEQAITYDAKVINNMCDIEGVMKCHYKGWNSHYDVVHIASKTKDPVPGHKVDNDTDSSKSPLEQKMVPSTTSRIRISSAVINSYSGARQAVKSVPFDTNVLGKSSLFVTSISSCSSKDLCDHNTPTTSICDFHENPMPSTSKNFYYPESDVNSVLLCEETIPGSPTSTSEEQNNQEGNKKALQELYEERKADSAIYAMNQSFHESTTLMGATKEKKTEEYTKILQKDGAILNQNPLQLLAEICCMNLKSINEDSVSEPPLEIEPKKVFEKIVKLPEIPQSEFRINSNKKISKYNTTALLSLAPEMTSSQRQALIIAEMNKLRLIYSKIKKKLAKILKKKKRIEKRKRKMAKAAVKI